MTTFKEIRGQLIRSVSTDPANPQEGQIWYNNTIGVLKGYQTVPAAWSSGTNIPSQPNYQQIPFAGTKTALITAGGAPGSTSVTTSLSYDGSTWTANTPMTDGRTSGGIAGVQTSSVAWGGTQTFSTITDSEDWDGTSWTASGTLNTATNDGGGTGTQTAALKAGGYTGLTGTQSVEEYNGSTWATGNNLPYGSPGTISNGLGGVQTAAFSAGGFDRYTPTPNTTFSNTSNYDGTNWTASGAMPATKCQAVGQGTQTAGLIADGLSDVASGPSINTNVFLYDGSVWTTGASNSTARREMGVGGGANSQPGSILVGGYDGASPIASVEEYNAAPIATVTLTTS